MKKINLIAAIGANNELGYNNDLIWHLKEDMKFFRNTTSGHPIVMGRKTFESLPRLLPNRTHLILSHQSILNPEVKTFHSKDELDAYLDKLNEEVFVIGGASLYKMYILEAIKIYLTEIKDSKKADVYFPEFNKEEFIKKTLLEVQEKSTYYRINEYTRRRSLCKEK